ncbi:MAG: alpha-amylase family glycosyl hydrolase, partial [Leifsonia sp.]
MPAHASTEPDWWRTAVIYQVYPRSFADSNGDGIGDLPGITARLDALVELGVDAVWLSPFFTSPQRDAGYDVADYTDVDPLFGTLADFDALLVRAHALSLRVIIDLVPNHSSSEHPWFQAELAAAPGSPERARYLFRDGKGPSGSLPPNNWQSVFGGPAWTRVVESDGREGQWYLHLFDTSQPDFDWTNDEVKELFRGVLRFWLERG